MRNRAVRSSVKTLIVKARRAIGESGADPAERQESTVEAIRALDRAAAKGILHPKNAARRKARLARQMAKVAAAPAGASGGKGKKGAAAAPPPAASKKK